MNEKITFIYELSFWDYLWGDTQARKNNLKKKNLYIRAIWQGFLGILVLCIFGVVYGWATENYGAKYREDYLKAYIPYMLAYMTAAYWEFRKTFESKWIYLADLFNKISEIKVDRKQDLYIKKNLVACLASDLLHMGFWSHDSYYYFFMNVLTEAIDFNLNDQEEENHKVKEWLYSGMMKNTEAEKYLEIYQIHTAKVLRDIQVKDSKRHN